jgi:hypothetical protein
VTEALLTGLSHRAPAPPAFPDGGGSNRRGWVVVAVIVVLVTAVVVGTRMVHAARQAAAEQQARVSASASHAMTWVRLIAEGNGFLADVLSCDELSQRHRGAAGLEGAFEEFLGGELVEGHVDHVDVVDGAHHVTFEGLLEDGEPVTFTVLVVGEDSGWRACGFGPPDRIP